jgi:hypothetical protein
MTVIAIANVQVCTVRKEKPFIIQTECSSTSHRNFNIHKEPPSVVAPVTAIGQRKIDGKSYPDPVWLFLHSIENILTIQKHRQEQLR